MATAPQQGGHEQSSGEPGGGAAQRWDVEGYRDLWEAACRQFDGQDEAQGCKLFHTAMMLHYEVPPRQPLRCLLHPICGS